MPSFCFARASTLPAGWDPFVEPLTEDPEVSSVRTVFGQGFRLLLVVLEGNQRIPLRRTLPEVVGRDC